MLEPINVWIYIFNPIQFKRTGFETIIEVKSKSLAIRKTNELNDKDYTKESLITKIKN